jgi:hypothetical protein
MTTTQGRLLTKDEVAERLKVKPKSVLRLPIERVRINKKEYRWFEAAVEQYIKTRIEYPAAPAPSEERPNRLRYLPPEPARPTPRTKKEIDEYLLALRLRSGHKSDTRH